MPSVTYDGQSLFVKGRRAWLVGAGFEYALTPPNAWAQRLDALRRDGANTVVASVPWLLHEPRPGRFAFEGRLDLARFLELCEERRLWVVLRIGPAIGEPFDGGGIPPWVVESGAKRLREFDERFLERTSAFYRAALAHAAPLQASELRPHGRRGVGPVVAISIEHRWRCDHDAAGLRYLGELVRFARENGAKVPLLTSNQLWQTIESAIDCWEGCDELLANLRQLRTIQSASPRIALLRDPHLASTWGAAPDRRRRLAELPRRVAETLAAGAMPLLLDAVGGVHAERSAGRRLGQPVASGEAIEGGYFEAIEPRGILADLHGRPIEGSGDLRRLLWFASSFAPLFAEAEPAYQPIAIDPGAASGGRARPRRRRHAPTTLLSLRGPGGQVAFLFAEDPADRVAELCLDDGRCLRVDLGDAALGWFVCGVDLRGRGHLDYSSLSPMGLLERRLLILFGPAASEGFLSIGGSHLDVKVPGRSAKPLTIVHREITIAVLNEAQSRTAVADGESLLVGCLGFDEAGQPIPAPGVKEFHRIALDGTVVREALPKRRNPRLPTIDSWSVLADPGCIDGSGPRFATLDGPASLWSCGVGSGYGWYRVRFRQPKAAKVHLDLPEAGDRLRIHLDGTLLGVFGAGPGAAPLPVEVSLGAGEHGLSILAEHLGRLAEGHGAEARSGVWGPIWETQPLAGVKVAPAEAPAVDPFKLRGFMPGLIHSEAPPESGLSITLTHRRKSPLLLDLGRWPVPATLLHNGAAIHRLIGDASARATLRLAAAQLEGATAGRHEFIVVPDHDHEHDLKALAKQVRVWECVREIGGAGAWGFARRQSAAEIREQTTWSPVSTGRGTANRTALGPAWFRGSVSIPPSPGTIEIDLSSMSKGEAYLDGVPLGTYFSRTSDGKPVGPSVLPVPTEHLVAGGTQELLLFDEDGLSPTQVRLRNV